MIPQRTPAQGAVPPVAKRTIDVRRGDERDYGAVARLSEAVYGMSRSLDSVRWLYTDNPAGACRLWLAVDRDSGEVIGLRPLFPWRVWVSDREIPVWQAGDAMTHPAFQGQGVFSALLRSAWTELHDEGVPFAFSFSNPGSMSVYRKITIGSGARAGTHVVLNFRRMVCPLSLRLVQERLGGGLDGLSGGLDVAYRAYRRWRLALPRGLSVSSVTRFDGEYDALWTRTAPQYGVLGVRNSRYLNWRYLDPPSGPFQILGLRAYGVLIGYAVFDVDAEGTGSIADIFGPPDADIITALFCCSLDVMIERGCLKASVWAAEEGRLYDLVRRVGFIPRAESFPMAVHVFQDAADAETALDGARWLAWFGDRDIEHLAHQPAR